MAITMFLKTKHIIYPLTLAMGTILYSQSAIAADNFTEVLTGGKANVDITVRYESVEVDGAPTVTAIT